MEVSELPEHILLGFDTSIIDMVVTVTEAFLKEHGYTTGGSTYNTIKIAQWMLNTNRNIVMNFGHIGIDKYADIIIEDSKRFNLDSLFYSSPNDLTSRCAICITGITPSFFTHIVCPKRFKEDFIDLPENCISFLQICHDTFFKIANHIAINNKYLAYSLTGPYLYTTYKDVLSEALKYTDALFCNDEEALAFSEVFGFNTDDLHEIVKRMQTLPKVNKKRERVVIITCGPNDTIVATVEGIKLFPVIHIDEDEIVDTTGAGDAFAGGFMSQLIQEKSLEDCIRAANYAANVIIKEKAIILPDKPNFK